MGRRNGSKERAINAVKEYGGTAKGWAVMVKVHFMKGNVIMNPITLYSSYIQKMGREISILHESSSFLLWNSYKPDMFHLLQRKGGRLRGDREVIVVTIQNS